MPDDEKKYYDSEAKRKWTKENSRFYGIKVMKRTESDILDYLEGKQAATEFKKGIRLLIKQENKEDITEE